VSRGMALAALALPGCAALVESDWQDHPSHAPLRPLHLVIADASMDRACGRHPSRYVYGCAVRIPSEGVCLVYTRAQPAAWILEHEYKHCDGWDHGPQPARWSASAAVE
jgi:hypothetical protein